MVKVFHKGLVCLICVIAVNACNAQDETFIQHRQSLNLVAYDLIGNSNLAFRSSGDSQRPKKQAKKASLLMAFSRGKFSIDRKINSLYFGYLPDFESSMRQSRSVYKGDIESFDTKWMGEGDGFWELLLLPLLWQGPY